MSDLSPLQRLYRIQVLDLELDRMREEESNFPAELQEARHAQDRLNNDLEDTEIQLEEVEKKIRQFELDVKTIAAQIEQTKIEQEKHAFDARTQSQYGSRLHQLEERADELQEDLVPLREQQQQLMNRAAELRQQHRELRPKLSGLEQADEARIEDIRQKAQNTVQERAQLAEQLDARTMKSYDMIRKAKKGVGMTEAKNGRCTACNVVLPVTIQQKVSQGKMPPVRCPSCGRFLIRLEI